MDPRPRDDVDAAQDIARELAEPGNNWGQGVKDCNQNNCYPGGSKRGEYVKGQAKDADGPGYGGEIHSLANPGNSDPQGAPTSRRAINSPVRIERAGLNESGPFPSLCPYSPKCLEDEFSEVHIRQSE